MIWFVFLFYLLFRWGILHSVQLVVGWCRVLYSSGFLCVTSHYLILPRVSSLVVGSWSQCSHCKGSGLDLFRSLHSVAHYWLNKADPSQEVLLWADLENTNPIPCLRCGLLAEPFLKNYFILFLAVLGLCCSVGFSLVAESVGYSLVASLLWLPLLWSTGSVALGLQQLWLPDSRAQAQ